MVGKAAMEVDNYCVQREACDHVSRVLTDDLNTKGGGSGLPWGRQTKLCTGSKWVVHWGGGECFPGRGPSMSKGMAMGG